jgi:teichuronic acid biosynthesis glycosyltransferase TuaG
MSLITVILPAFNAEHVLPRAIQSVQAQSLDQWEILIIDDASTDGTRKIAQSFAATDVRIQLHALDQNVGAARARNLGLLQAKTRFVAFLDADDAWTPNKLALQLGMMSEKNAALSYTGFVRHWTTPKGAAKQREIPVPVTVTRQELLWGNIIACQTVICDRHLLGDFQMPDLRRRQDFALWLELLKRVDAAHGINQPLCHKFEQPGSLSASRLTAMAATWQVYRLQGCSPAQTGLYLASHLIRRFLRG